MLPTNGSVAARDRYDADAGEIVLLASKSPAPRVPVGIAKFKIRYRLAGLHEPGVGQLMERLRVSPIDAAQQNKVIEAQPQVNEP